MEGEAMINLIREYLLKLVDNIDAGNSNLTEDETIKLISVLKELTDRERRLSKVEEVSLKDLTECPIAWLKKICMK